MVYFVNQKRKKKTKEKEKIVKLMIKVIITYYVRI